MGKKGGKVDDEYVVKEKKGGKENKGKKGRNREIECSDYEDDVSSFISNISYQNNLERESLGEGSLTGESGIEDSDQSVDMQLEIALEAAALKNSVVRTKNLAILTELFRSKILGECLQKRTVEVTEVILKSLKNGKGVEKTKTAQLAVLFTLQAGEELDLEDFYQEIRPLLLNSLGSERAGILQQLATLCFICTDSLDDRKEMLLLLRDLTGCEDKDLAISAMAATSLILTVCSPTERRNTIEMILISVIDQLKHNNVDVRIQAGETLAHFFEMGRDYNPDFDDTVDGLQSIFDDLETLSRDSAKFRAKRDRKQQRASFREILGCVMDNEGVKETVKISAQETLAISSWSEKVQYSALKESLGVSTSLHLQQNVFVREILGLGPPPLRAEPISKGDKIEMKKLNAACNKARQRNMLKQRDKRMIV